MANNDKIVWDTPTEDIKWDTPDNVTWDKQEKPALDVTGGLIGAGAGVGAAGAVYGAAKLGDYWVAPSKQIAPIDEQFKIWQQQNPSLEGTMNEDMPSLINRQIQDVKSSYGANKQYIQQQFSEGQKVLKQNMTKLDRGILNTSVENLADLVSTESPKIIQDTYKGYGAAVDAADEFMASKGQTISGSSFKSMLEDVAQNAYKKGVPEGSLQSLLSDIPTESLTIKQAKGLMKNLGNDLPLDAKYSLQEGWARFLETNASPESAAMLKNVNTLYRPFVDLRKQITGAGGDRKKIFGVLYDYATNKARMSKQTVEDLMKTLSEGTDLTPAIQGVKEGFNAVKGAQLSRTSLGNAIKQSEISKTIRLQNVAKIKQQIDDLVAWRNKAENLLSQKGAIVSESPIRTQGLLKTLTGTGKLIGRLGRVGLMGIGENILINKMLEYTMGTSDPRLLMSPLTGDEQAFEEFKKMQLDRQMI